MKHFIVFLIFVFGGLSAYYVYYGDTAKTTEEKKVYVYASSSFVAQWGPGPELKQLFEKQHLYKIEFVEISDINMALQKINFEAEASLADVMMGLDQFDVVRHSSKIKWRDINRNENLDFIDEIKPLANDRNFVPYDWAPMTFVGRRSADLGLNKMSDLLQESLAGKIALQDPRTSSPGLQFLVWIFENNSTEKAIAFLKSMQRQVHSYSPSWSTSYGLFKNNQADLVFSYVTSPIYHQVEEKDNNYFGHETQEPLAAQVEFAGIPASCKNCEGAELFISFLHSPQAQKILMSKNYMFPVIHKVKEATPFDALKVYRTLPLKFHEASQIEKWLNTWAEVRKNEAR